MPEQPEGHARSADDPVGRAIMSIPGHTGYCKRLANSRKVLELFVRRTRSDTATTMTE
jgi:hypothetical protein